MLLSSGPKRFNELRRLVGGISQRMLTLTLRGLERDGLVTRAVEPTIPPRVEYDLTKTGRTLIDAVVALADWAKAHSGYIEKARQSYDAKHRKTASV
jgi:DNA-binding HxlR family transcriptional regulator